mgnify:CR=1 FL=1
MVKYVVDDHKDFEIKAKAPPPPELPKAKIERVYYPDEASPGEEVTVTVDVTNEGGTGVIFCRLRDLETGEQIAFKDEEVEGGGDVRFKITFKMPNKTLKLRVEVGHYE